MLKFGSLSVISLYILFSACGQTIQRNGQSSNKELKEPLIEENKKQVKAENQSIDQFIERRKWEMVETGTGLRYMIYQNGFGLNAETGMYATVNYEISLIDGTICYTSLENGPRRFLIGKDNVESGIHEGITYMKVGDKAKLIIPSYLAQGLVGDQNKIPPRATLIVDLHLTRLE